MNNLNKYLAFPEHSQRPILVFNTATLNAVRIANLLEQFGYTNVTTVIEPRLVMPILTESGNYGAVLMDLDLPDLEGLKLIYGIRKEFSAAELPILAISDKDSPEASNAALFAGANDCLLKPLEPINLALRLRNQLTVNGIHNTNRNHLHGLGHKVTNSAEKLNLLIGNSLLMGSTHECSKLIRRTLFEGRRLLHCDAASIYLVTDDKQLRFAMRTRKDELASNDIALFDPATGQPNERYVSTYCALQKQSVRIDDVYQESQFDLTGTRAFDALNGYRTTSLLTVPMISRDGDVIGVLQFVNKIDPATNTFVAFPADQVAFVEALASQAAVLIDNLALNEERLAEEDTRRQLSNQIAQLDRQRSMENLSASLGHELNQPLTAILTNAQIAARGLQSEGFAPAMHTELLNRIAENARRANRIVERIRGFIRPSEESRKPVVLQAVVFEVAGLLENELRARAVELVLPRGINRVRVLADSIQLTQIILNVLRNAIEAVQQAENRKVVVTICSEDTRAVVRIRDFGHGLSEVALLQAGTPFFTTKPTGLGMGLSISRNIATHWGGTLTIANAAEGGAQVELNLPEFVPAI